MAYICFRLNALNILPAAADDEAYQLIGNWILLHNLLGTRFIFDDLQIGRVRLFRCRTVVLGRVVARPLLASYARIAVAKIKLLKSRKRTIFK